MAANKFATMLHKNTPRITVVLVYAFLEWTLILLLLLHSCFSFLISKFASYFGLPTPCLWCSSFSSSSIPHLCESHAKHVSALSYCTSHRRLADSSSICLDCLASAPRLAAEARIAAAFSFITWVASTGDDEVANQKKKKKKRKSDDGKECSCCGEIITPDLYPPPPYLLLEPLKCRVEDPRLMAVGIEAAGDDGVDNQVDCLRVEDGKVEVSGEERRQEEEGERQGDCLEMEFVRQDEPSSGDHDRFIEYCFGEDDLLDIISLHHLHDDSGSGFDRSLPVELIHSSTSSAKQEVQGDEALVDAEEECNEGVHSEEEESARGIEIGTSMENSGERSLAVNLEECPLPSFCSEVIAVQEGIAEDTAALMLNDEFEELHNASANGLQEESTPLPSQIEEQHREDDEDKEESEPAVAVPQQSSHATSNGFGELLHSLDPINTSVAKNEEGAENPGQELHCPSANELQKESTSLPSQIEEEEEDNDDDDDDDDEGKEESEPAMVIPQQSSHATSNGFGELLHSLDPIYTSDAKNDEGTENPGQEKLPDTPNSMDSNHNSLHDKLLIMFEKRDSRAEESFDGGSVVSEADNGDPVLTVERLRTALKSERNALNALYAELEEERSASAIAANQTMAMINRLQEEKAAMQMEALQYQRMMEEQSEYDQEALQLLNDLMIKREKEKQELERELEFYRKRVMDYEAREKLRIVRSRRRSEDGSLRSVNSSATCSNGEDSEELSSIDLNREARDDSGSMSENPESMNGQEIAAGDGEDDINLEEIAMDCVHHMTSLDDSLAEFEDERLSILDQLKMLEEKLLYLRDSDEPINNVNSLNYSSVSQHGFDDSYDNESSTPEEENGAKETKPGPERKTMGSMAKSLLPLLDAAEDDDVVDMTMSEKKALEISGMDDDSSSVVSRFGGETKKLAIEEEVDHVYERLQALEADREFLKHCMSSIQKGDKGMDLLQEILQHLRDLRAAELRVRSMSESPLELT